MIVPLLFFWCHWTLLTPVRLSWICIKMGILALSNVQGFYKDDINYVLHIALVHGILPFLQLDCNLESRVLRIFKITYPYCIFSNKCLLD